MTAKTLPLSATALESLTEQYPTPFYLYDEAQIRARVTAVQQAFAWNKGFREYFAVKALPNLSILQLLNEMGCGADCASQTELMLASRAGMRSTSLMFTSNNTPAHEFKYARELDAIINLDAINLIDFLAQNGGIPELICCRYTPDHEVGASNKIMGETGQAKFGMTREQLFQAFTELSKRGAKRFGIHCMAASNSLDNDYYPALAVELFDLAVEIKDRLGIAVEFINFAGGLGIPYFEDQSELDLPAIGSAVHKEYEKRLTPAGLEPAIFTELGRYLTGPTGYLVTRVLHRKSTYKDYVGVDASAVHLIRPAMYGAHHHLSVVGKSTRDTPTAVYDVVGSLCENNDKFAIDRELPVVEEGDLVVIHDAGAHSHSMGYNYNGKLKCAEVLLRPDGSTKLIRRAETPEDYFATLNF